MTAPQIVFALTVTPDILQPSVARLLDAIRPTLDPTIVAALRAHPAPGERSSDDTSFGVRDIGGAWAIHGTRTLQDGPSMAEVARALVDALGLIHAGPGSIVGDVSVAWGLLGLPRLPLADTDTIAVIATHEEIAEHFEDADAFVRLAWSAAHPNTAGHLLLERGVGATDVSSWLAEVAPRQWTAWRLARALRAGYWGLSDDPTARAFHERERCGFARESYDGPRRELALYTHAHGRIALADIADLRDRIEQRRAPGPLDALRVVFPDERAARASRRPCFDRGVDVWFVGPSGEEQPCPPWEELPGRLVETQITEVTGRTGPWFGPLYQGKTQERLPRRDSLAASPELWRQRRTFEVGAIVRVIRHASRGVGAVLEEIGTAALSPPPAEAEPTVEERVGPQLTFTGPHGWSAVLHAFHPLTGAKAPWSGARATIEHHGKPVARGLWRGVREKGDTDRPRFVDLDAAVDAGVLEALALEIFRRELREMFPEAHPYEYEGVVAIVHTDDGICEVDISDEGVTFRTWAMPAAGSSYRPRVGDRVVVGLHHTENGAQILRTA